MDVGWRRGLVYSIAAGTTLIAHAALIWYGANAAVSAPFSHPEGEKFFAVQFASEKIPVPSKRVVSTMRELDAGGRKNMSAMTSAEPEQLFPAFYGMHYYEPKELTQKPLVTLDIPQDFALRVPNAPENAAIFLLLINEHGGIDKVLVESSSLPQSAQAELENVFKTVKFLPGQIKGKAVKSALKIQIRLDAEATTK